MKWLKNKESLVLIFLFLSLIGFSAWLYYDINKVVGIGNRNVIGTITFKKNAVQRKLDDQVIWTNIQQSSPLTEGDTILAHPEADAVIHLNDGTEISIDENSMFTLEIKNNQAKLDLSKGSIQYKKAPSQETDAASSEGNPKESKSGKTEKASSSTSGSNQQYSGILISSGGKTIEMGDGEVKLETKSGESLNVFVQKGNAKVSSGGKSVAVESGKAAQLEGTELKVTQIPVIAYEPANNGFLSTPLAESEILFRFDVSKDVESPVLEISRVTRFEPLVSSQAVSQGTNTIRKEIREGTYYWRVRDKNNSSSLSPVWKFTLMRELPPALQIPSDKSEFTYFENPPLIQLQWTDSPLASHFQVQVSKSSSFSDLLIDQKLQSNSYSLDKLETGSYYWRVVYNYISPDLKQKVIGPQSFHVEKKEGLTPPEVMRPLPGENITSDMLAKAQILWIWKGNPEVNAYQFEMGPSPDFKSPTVSQKITQNFWKPPTTMAEGNYYWRIKSMTNSGIESPFSSALPFQIVAELPPPPEPEKVVVEPAKPKFIWSLESPIATVVDTYPIKELVFKWKAHPDAKLYSFKLFLKTDTEKKLVVDSKPTINSFTLPDPKNLKDGNYIWEVVVYKTEKEIIESAQANIICYKNKFKNLKQEDLKFISPDILFKEGE